MDDLELLRRFRSDVPPPDEGARLAALSVIRGETPRRERPSRRPARRWKVAAAVAATLAIALAVPVLIPGGQQGAAPEASAVLLRVADVAAQQEGDGPPGPGQYVYTKTKSVYENDWADAGPNKQGFAVLMPQIREIWIGTNGSGRILETNGTPRFLTDRDREVWEASGRPDLGGNTTSDETYQPEGAATGGKAYRVPTPGASATAIATNSLSFLDLSGLPTDTDQLRDAIESRQIEGGPPGDAETFTIIGDLLRETYASPALRSALYRVAAGLSGVELVGDTKDPVGRDGIAVAYGHDGLRHELIFDPATSALLGERYVIVDPSRGGFDVAPGTVVGWAAYLSSGIVDSTSDRP
jgi:hypothetical protein